jgi:hypothetical protein
MHELNEKPSLLYLKDKKKHQYKLKNDMGTFLIFDYFLG